MGTAMEIHLPQVDPYEPDTIRRKRDSPSSSDSPLADWLEQISNEEEIHLGETFAYDGSKLTPSQWSAIYHKKLNEFLDFEGLELPKEWKIDSPCLSLPEDLWPALAAPHKIYYLQNGYLDPVNLIQRLEQLKPEDNFVLRTIDTTYYSPASPRATRLGTPTYNLNFPWAHYWSSHNADIDITTDEPCTQDQKRLAQVAAQDHLNYWESVEADAKSQAITAPDLKFLKNISRTPGGSLVPPALFKLLTQLINDAVIRIYQERNALEKHLVALRDRAIAQWQSTNPSIVLADDVCLKYRTWPSELMDELHRLDVEWWLRAWEKYLKSLEIAQDKMQHLATFWRECGLMKDASDLLSEPVTAHTSATAAVEIAVSSQFGVPVSAEHVSQMHKEPSTRIGRNLAKTRKKTLPADQRNVDTWAHQSTGLQGIWYNRLRPRTQVGHKVSNECVADSRPKGHGLWQNRLRTRCSDDVQRVTNSVSSATKKPKGITKKVRTGVVQKLKKTSSSIAS